MNYILQFEYCQLKTAVPYSCGKYILVTFMERFTSSLGASGFRAKSHRLGEVRKHWETN